MKKKSYYIVIIIVSLFIGMNLYLLLKEDSKAERTVNVNEWTRVAIGDVIQTFKTDGVALPASEHYVYFDRNQGNMASFLVEEGDIIASGSPLFSYDTKELEKQKVETEIEIKRLEEELDSIELQISELKKIDTKVPARTNSSQESEVTVVVDMSVVAKSSVEESIAVAEADIRKIEANLAAEKKKLDQLEEQMDDATVFSDIGGHVVRINKNLEGPIMTIASSELAIEGVLSQQQMKEVEVGQKVTLHSDLYEHPYSGVISKIHQYPKENPSIGSEPVYSFIATLEEETDDDEEIENDSVDSFDPKEEKEREEDRLLIGTNLQINVIVEEALGVPIISTDSMFSVAGNKNVYKLASDGIIKQQEVLTGVTFEGKTEVESGIVYNEIIASKPKNISYHDALFIVPMKMSGLKTEELRSMTKKQYAKYVLMGLLEN